jgi:hypothetical protein
MVTSGPEDDSYDFGIEQSGAHLDANFVPIEEQDREPEDEYHTALPPKVESWRKRSVTGAILTGFALGLQEALETKRQEPAIVVQTSGDPPRDLPVEADFEYARPRQSVVSIRPWLLEGPADGERPPGRSEERAGDREAGTGEP